MEELSAMITEVQVEEGVPAELINHELSKDAAENVMKILSKTTVKEGQYLDPTICLTLNKFRDWLLKGKKNFVSVSC